MRSTFTDFIESTSARINSFARLGSIGATTFAGSVARNIEL
jgi:hypothetical protein